MPEVLRCRDLEVLDDMEGQRAPALGSDADHAKDVDLPAFLTADLPINEASMAAADRSAPNEGG